MDIQKQNEFLLSLVSLLLADLGGDLAFLEWVKMVSQGRDIDGVLAQCRRDPVVKPAVDAYLQWLAVQLAQSVQLDPGLAYREFLRQWTELGKAN
jgi:hypothetical protein